MSLRSISKSSRVWSSSSPSSLTAGSGNLRRAANRSPDRLPLVGAPPYAGCAGCCKRRERMRRAGLIAVAVVLGLTVLPLQGAAMQTVGLSISTLNNPFFVDLRDGAQAAAAKTGVMLVILDAQNDPAKQASSIEDLIAKKVSLVVINPTDSDAIVPTVKKLNAAKIPVITVDRGATGGDIVAHIASDNVAGGVMAAEYVGKRLNGKGTVIMLEGIAGTSAARDRGKGFRDGLKKYPGITLAASQTADFDRAKGL